MDSECRDHSGLILQILASIRTIDARVDELSDFVKNRYVKNSVEYKIKIVEGEEIIIQDLVDVRYDFIKDNLRNIDVDESTRINNEIDIFLKMVEKIRILNDKIDNKIN